MEEEKKCECRTCPLIKKAVDENTKIMVEVMDEALTHLRESLNASL